MKKVALSLAALLLAPIIIVAAPKSVIVAIQSDPPGAMVYQDGAQMGYTPAALKYPTSKAFQKGAGCDAGRALTVRWVSGAEASIDGLSICPQAGGRQQFVFLRPTGAEGRELDVQFSIQMLQLGAMQEAARTQAAADAWRRTAETLQQNFGYRRPVTCTTTALGNQITTNCY